MMGQFVVYVIRCSVNGKAYVGKTGRPRHRWYVHKCLAKTQEGTRLGESALYRAIRKHGVQNFSFEILERCRDEAHAFERERHWIAELKTFGPAGYNMSAGGEGQSGFRHREESKLLMANRGEANGCFGRVWTDEERARHAKLTRAQFKEFGHPFLGRKHSAESRAKMSAAAMGHKRCVGRKYSPETIAKMRESHRGRPAWNKGLKTGPLSDETKAKKSAKMREYWARRRAAKSMPDT